MRFGSSTLVLIFAYVALNLLEGVATSTLTTLPIGFPASYLPPANDTASPAGSLQLPLNPSQHLDFRLEIILGPGSSKAGLFRGGQLISSSLSMAIFAWQNAQNLPISHNIYQRNEPFRNILHIIQPTLLSETLTLTPLTVGIVYCWMMHRVTERHTWPGVITAGIYNKTLVGRLGLPLGVIEVQNQPEAFSANKTDLEPYSTQNGNSSIVIDVRDNNHQLSASYSKAARERVWFGAFYQMVIWVLEKPPSGRVINSIAPIPGTYSTMHFYSRLDVTPRIVGNLSISKYVGTLPWKSVAETMLDLSIRAAQADRWECEETANVVWEGIIVVRIKFGRVSRLISREVAGGKGREVTHEYHQVIEDM